MLLARLFASLLPLIATLLRGASLLGTPLLGTPTGLRLRLRVCIGPWLL
jgi:hypothetical protein